MTNTPSPTDEDRELIERMERARDVLSGHLMPHEANAISAGIDRLESLLSDRAKLERQVQELLTRYP